MRKAAQDIDKLEMGVIENLLGMHVPLHGEGLGWECPLQLPIQALYGRSFQHWVIRQPIKMGGLGIRACHKSKISLNFFGTRIFSWVYIRVSQKNLIFEFDHGVEFEHTIKKKSSNPKFSVYQTKYAGSKKV